MAAASGVCDIPTIRVFLVIERTGWRENGGTAEITWLPRRPIPVPDKWWSNALKND
jgi:hypothetical protein